MAHHYHSRHWSHEQDYNRNLASRFSRDARHSGHPTQYIVNEGKMIVDEQTLKHSNAIIYNAPEATLRLSSKSKPNPFTPQEHHQYGSYHYPPASSWWAPTSLSVHTCRNCLQRREIYHAGYCHNCAAYRLVLPYQTDRRVRDDRRVTFASDRRQLKWR
ncbi:hypothetical protein F4818DRAFT_433886 [Hypoxylon cercidicola]|nr:hypothetical protein F4818DRAFT_433886 [Hypoxylon cercidicola]